MKSNTKSNKFMGEKEKETTSKKSDDRREEKGWGKRNTDL